MAVTRFRHWPKGLATSGYSLATLTPWIQSSPANRNVIWVDSTSTATADGSFERPYTTLAAAVGDPDVVTNESPIIVCKSSHAETLTAAVTKATTTGVTIIGLGTGTSRPTFTVGGAVYGIDTTAAGSSWRFYNLRFASSTAAASARIRIRGNGCLVKDCDFTFGTSDTANPVGVSIESSFNRLEGCTFTASGDATTRPGSAVAFGGSTFGNYLKDCTFDGGTYGWNGNALTIGLTDLDWAIENITLKNGSLVANDQASYGWIAGVNSTGVVDISLRV